MNLGINIRTVFSVFIAFISLFPSFGQRGLSETERSEITGITFQGRVLKDNRLLSQAAARTVLEMESGPYQVTLSDLEVFSVPNPGGQIEDAREAARGIVNSLAEAGYEVYSSANNPEYSWLRGNNRMLLMYVSSTKNETGIYFGRADNLPPVSGSNGIVRDEALTGPPPAGGSSATGNAIPETSTNTKSIENKDLYPSGLSTQLHGSWGMISGSPINYIDEGNYNVVSGVSRGFGLELHGDGTYLQISVIESGRPNYRIHVSTTGTWTAEGNLLLFSPAARQYRRWENELLKTDEHSVPEAYTMIWHLAKNEASGKDCLYVKWDETQAKWDELCGE